MPNIELPNSQATPTAKVGSLAIAAIAYVYLAFATQDLLPVLVLFAATVGIAALESP